MREKILSVDSGREKCQLEHVRVKLFSNCLLKNPPSVDERNIRSDYRNKNRKYSTLSRMLIQLQISEHYAHLRFVYLQVSVKKFAEFTFRFSVEQFMDD